MFVHTECNFASKQNLPCECLCLWEDQSVRWLAPGCSAVCGSGFSEVNTLMNYFRVWWRERGEEGRQERRRCVCVFVSAAIHRPFYWKKKSDHRSDLFLRHAWKDFLVSLVSCCLYNRLLCMWVRRAESETIRKFGAILLLGYFQLNYWQTSFSLLWFCLYLQW